MAWNHPAASTNDTSKTKNKTIISPRAKGIVIGVVAISILAVLGYILFSGNDATAPKSETAKAQGKIKEVTPAPARTNVVAKVEDGLTPTQRKIKHYKELFGTNMPEGVKAEIYFLEHPVKQTFKTPNPFHFLSHPSERDIASLAKVEPGTFFLMQPTYGEAFDNDFINAMLDKIEYSDDDTDEIREAKATVAELKKELAKQCKEEGRKPSEIMNEFAKTLYDLGQYQRQLENELNELHENPDLSDADVEDFFKAANKMLEQKGLKPMEIPNLAKRSIRLQRRLARQAGREQKSKQQ